MTAEALLSDSAPEPDLLSFPTALSLTLSLKTPAPIKKVKQAKKPSPSQVKTDSDSPHMPKGHTLQWHESYLNMDDFDIPNKPMVVTKKSLPGSRGAGIGAKGRDGSNASIGDNAPAWREWKARETGAGMEMDVNPVEASGKQKGRKKSQHKMINAINIDVNMASLGERKNVKGKGKGKLVRIDEDMEMTASKFIVPAQARLTVWEVASDGNAAL